ncbi:hypothetical protein, partial [uncultured Helicobacter sp.]|uniref:hypothetical protein n=1 Tax=uncultured Helicobacter sp. TaxID=175537 RepID=UPI0026380FCD
AALCQKLSRVLNPLQKCLVYHTREKCAAYYALCVESMRHCIKFIKRVSFKDWGMGKNPYKA